jgi:hypothetical protein
MPVVSDDFNRANGAVGGDWSTLSGSAAPLIVSNHLEATANDQPYAAEWSADALGNDQWAEIDATLGSAYSEVVVSVRSDGEDGYEFYWYTDAGGSYALERRQSGSDAVLVDLPGVGTTGTRRLRIEAAGPTINCLVDGVVVISVFDSTFTAGAPEISLYRNGGTTPTIDNFAAGDNIVSDNFNRANGGLGSNWETVGAGPALEIASNFVIAPSTNAEARVSLWNGSFEDDQWAEAFIDFQAATGSLGLEVRDDGTGTTSYFFQWAADDGGTINIYKNIAGSFTVLDEVTGVGTGEAYIRLEAIGTSIKVYADGVEVMSATDSDITSGRPGIWIYWPSSSPTPGVLDAFAAGPLVPPATVEQEGFLWRNDDGDEDGATARESQDVDAEADLAENVRLRVLLDAAGDPVSAAYTLRYKLSTDSEYLPVLVGATTTVPTYVASGAQSINAGAITPALPAGIAVGDVLVMFVETANQATSIANGNGATWTEIGTQVGTGTAGSTSATRLSMWWTRYDGVITTGPTTNDSGDHQLGRIAAFRGCKSTGSPIDAVATFAAEAGPSTINIPAVVTTVDNTLVVAAVADDWDNASTTRYGSWTNANLASISERIDGGSTTQNGGGLGMATGTKASAGSTGAWTASANASILANVCGAFALAPEPRPIFVSPSANITAGGEATTALLTPPSGKTSGDFTTGRMWDNENGTDTIDIVVDEYTELEWCLAAQAPADYDDVYQFRVYAGSTPLDTYTVTPELTIAEPTGTDVNPVGSVSTSVSAAAALTATTAVNPVGSVSSPVSAAANVSAQADVNPVGSVSTPVSPTANVDAAVPVNPVGSVSSPVSATAQVTVTAAVSPVGSVSSPVSAAANVTAQADVTPVGSVSSPVSPAANVTGVVAPAGSVSTSVSATANVGGQADVDPVGSVSSPVSATGQIGTASGVDATTSVATTVSAAADVTAQADVDPVGSVSSPVSATAQISATTAVTPRGSVSMTFSAAANVSGSADVDPTGSVSTPVSATGAVTSTTQVDPVGSVSTPVSPVALVVTTTLVEGSTSVITPVSAQADVAGQADVDPVGSVCLTFSAQAELNPIIVPPLASVTIGLEYGQVTIGLASGAVGIGIEMATVEIGLG